MTSGACSEVVNFSNPIFSDNCFSFLTQIDGTNLTSGMAFPVGVTTLDLMLMMVVVIIMAVPSV